MKTVSRDSGEINVIEADPARVIHEVRAHLEKYQRKMGNMSCSKTKKRACRKGDSVFIRTDADHNPSLKRSKLKPRFEMAGKIVEYDREKHRIRVKEKGSLDGCSIHHHISDIRTCPSDQQTSE
jgi:hypothetical protein